MYRHPKWYHNYSNRSIIVFSYCLHVTPMCCLEAFVQSIGAGFTFHTFQGPEVFVLVASTLNKLQKLSVSHQILTGLKLWNAATQPTHIQTYQTQTYKLRSCFRVMAYSVERKGVHTIPHYLNAYGTTDYETIQKVTLPPLIEKTLTLLFGNCFWAHR